MGTPDRHERDQFDLCGAMGHAMEPIEAERGSSVGWVWLVRCTRCGTQRRDVHDIRGKVNSRSYKMTQGYRRHRDKHPGFGRADYKVRVHNTLRRQRGREG